MKILISEGNKKSEDGIFTVDKMNCSSVQKKLLKRMLEADDKIEMKESVALHWGFLFFFHFKMVIKKQYIILL